MDQRRFSLPKRKWQLIQVQTPQWRYNSKNPVERDLAVKFPRNILYVTWQIARDISAKCPQRSSLTKACPFKRSLTVLMYQSNGFKHLINGHTFSQKIMFLTIVNFVLFFSSICIWAKGLQICLQNGNQILSRAFITSDKYTMGQHDGSWWSGRCTFYCLQFWFGKAKK